MSEDKEAEAIKPKFYFTGRAGMPIRAGKNRYQFERLYSVGGSMYGVYKAEEEYQQKELDTLVKDKKLTSISEEQYNEHLKKKDVSLNQSSVRTVDGKRPTPHTPEATASPATNDGESAGGEGDVAAPPTTDHSSSEAETGGSLATAPDAGGEGDVAGSDTGAGNADAGDKAGGTDSSPKPATGKSGKGKKK